MIIVNLTHFSILLLDYNLDTRAQGLEESTLTTKRPKGQLERPKRPSQFATILFLLHKIFRFGGKTRVTAVKTSSFLRVAVKIKLRVGKKDWTVMKFSV